MESQDRILLYNPNVDVRLDVRLEDDTVWLNRSQLAELFARDIKTIGKHINNALREELSDMATVAKFATVQTEGNRLITRQVEYYRYYSAWEDFAGMVKASAGRVADWRKPVILYSLTAPLNSVSFMYWRRPSDLR